MASANNFTNVGVGTGLGGGFTVTAGNVDILGSNFFGGSGSGQALDLNGFGPGTIAVTIATTANTTYVVSFRAGVNNSSSSAAAVRTATLSANNTPFGTISRTGASGSYSNGSFSFVGTGGSTVVSLAGNQGGTGGVLLDNISIDSVATPAPAGLLVLAGAAGLLGLARRFRA